MNNKTLKIIQRVQRKNAIGLIYNMPKDEMALLVNDLHDRKSHVSVNGKFADDFKTLIFRLGKTLNVKNLSYDLLPTVLDDKIVTVIDADFVKPSFNKVFENMAKYKVPMLLLFKNGVAMERVRKFNSYGRVFTIEQDYSAIKK